MPESAQTQPLISERPALRVPRLSEWLDLIANSDRMPFAAQTKTADHTKEGTR